MNQKRRASIRNIISTLRGAYDSVYDITEEEQSSFDNLPENFQESDRGDIMSDNITTLETAADTIQDAINKLEEVV